MLVLIISRRNVKKNAWIYCVWSAVSHGGPARLPCWQYIEPSYAGSWTTVRLHTTPRPLPTSWNWTEYSTGAGAIQLMGARAPKFLTVAAARGHNRIYGAPVKNKKRLMKQPNIQQRKCSACHWQRTHCHSSTALSITLCFMSAQTVVRHRFSSSTSGIAVW